MSQKHVRQHVAQLKRNAIADLHLECQRLEENIHKMKSDMQQLKQTSLIGRRRKRRHSSSHSQDRRPRGVPGIWSNNSTSRPRMTRMDSADRAGGISLSSSRSSLVY